MLGHDFNSYDPTANLTVIRSFRLTKNIIWIFLLHTFLGVPLQENAVGFLMFQWVILVYFKTQVCSHVLRCVDQTLSYTWESWYSSSGHVWSLHAFLSQKYPLCPLFAKLMVRAVCSGRRPDWVNAPIKFTLNSFWTMFCTFIKKKLSKKISFIFKITPVKIYFPVISPAHLCFLYYFN